MRETTWELRGMRFSCLEWGDPDDPGPPTVLLHGYLDHAGAWEAVAPALSGWRIALDQRGHGRAAWARRDSVHRLLAASSHHRGVYRRRRRADQPRVRVLSGNS